MQNITLIFIYMISLQTVMKLRYKHILFLTVFFTLSVASHAQSLWTSAEAKYDFSKKLSASLEGEYRTTNKFSSTERWTVGIGADYKVCPYFRVGAQYKFLYKHIEERITNKGNIIDSYWQPRQRFSLSLTGLYKWNRFTFSLRERYQYTHHKSMYVSKFDGDDGSQKLDEYIAPKDKNVLRSRLKIDYSIRKTGLTPFVSVEVYNDLKRFAYNKTRITAGGEYKINKHNSIEAYYRFIDQADQDDTDGHIIGIGYQFKF